MKYHYALVFCLLLPGCLGYSEAVALSEHTDVERASFRELEDLYIDNMHIIGYVPDFQRKVILSIRDKSDWPEYDRRLIDAQKIRIGFTRLQVAFAWGGVSQDQRRYYGVRGVSGETWRYYRNSVRFRNGRVSAFFSY